MPFFSKVRSREMPDHRRMIPCFVDPGMAIFDFCVPKPGTGSLESGRGCVGMVLLLAKDAPLEELAIGPERGRRDFGVLIVPAADEAALICEVDGNLLDKGPCALGPDMGLCKRALTPVKVGTAADVTSASVEGSVHFALKPSTPVSLLFILTFDPSSVLLFAIGAGLAAGASAIAGIWPGGGRKTPLRMGRWRGCGGADIWGWEFSGCSDCRAALLTVLIEPLLLGSGNVEVDAGTSRNCDWSFGRLMMRSAWTGAGATNFEGHANGACGVVDVRTS